MIGKGLFATALVFVAACATHQRAPFVARAVEPTAVDEPVHAASAIAQEQPETVASASAPVQNGGTVGDAVSLGLCAVEARLGRGELELAVVDLLGLAQRFPADPRVASRLSRVLHQRALQRYGQGSVAAAIHDWERVVALDPGHVIAANLLAAARSESADSQPPGSQPPGSLPPTSQPPGSLPPK